MLQPVKISPLAVSRAAPTLNFEYGAIAASRAAVAFEISSGFIGIEEALKEHSEIGVHLGRRIEHLFVIYGFARYACGDICQHGQAGDPQAHMPCNDGF